MSTPERYLIRSFEHRAWWGPGRVGYTTATHRAGIYAAEEANEICNEANRSAIEDFMVPAPSQSQLSIPTWPKTGQPVLPQPASTRTISSAKRSTISEGARRRIRMTIRRLAAVAVKLGRRATLDRFLRPIARDRPRRARSDHDGAFIIALFQQSLSAVCPSPLGCMPTDGWACICRWASWEFIGLPGLAPSGRRGQISPP